MTFDELKVAEKVLKSYIYMCDNGELGEGGELPCVRELRIKDVNPPIYWHQDEIVSQALRQEMDEKGKEILYLRCIDEDEEDGEMLLAINDDLEVIATHFHHYSCDNFSFDKESIRQKVKQILLDRAERA